MRSEHRTRRVQVYQARQAAWETVLSEQHRGDILGALGDPTALYLWWMRSRAYIRQPQVNISFVNWSWNHPRPPRPKRADLHPFLTVEVNP